MNIDDLEQLIDKFELGYEVVVATQETKGLVDEEELAIARSLDNCLVFHAKTIKVVVNTIFAFLHILVVLVVIFWRLNIFLAFKILTHGEYVGMLPIIWNFIQHLFEELLGRFTLNIINFGVFDSIWKNPILDNFGPYFDVFIVCGIRIAIYLLGWKISLIL